MNHNGPGIIFSGQISNGGNQPPRNKITVILLIKIILAYSPRKNSANDIDEYSTKSNNNIINDIYTSYDLSLNSKYKVKIFNQTIDRVKNYFR